MTCGDCRGRSGGLREWRRGATAKLDEHEKARLTVLSRLAKLVNDVTALAEGVAN